MDGGCQVYIDADDPGAYVDLESVFVEINGNLVPFFIEDIAFLSPKKAVFHFEEIDTFEQAQALVSSPIFLPLSELPKLADGKFYYHDVIGFKVVDQTLGELGVVDQFFTEGVQDLLQMVYKETEILIPVVDAIVLRADLNAKILHVNLPEGLLDIYFEG